MDKSLPPIKKGNGEDDENWAPRNWHCFKKTDKDLKKLAPQLKSRYQAYEEPSKEVSEAATESMKRLLERKKMMTREHKPTAAEELEDKEKHEKLIGQLKAAEARNRIRIMRLRYEANRMQEVNHLIACQPTARKAVRLQALVPVRPEDRSRGDTLDKLSRARCEALLEDNLGLLIGRT